MRYVDLGSVRYKREKKKTNGRHIILFLALFIGVFFVFGLLFLKGGIHALLSPLSVFSKIGGGRALEETDGVTNILLLGLDKRDKNKGSNGVLTDTMIVISIKSKDKKAIMLSIPRDLWVRLGDNTYGKVNSAYGIGGIDLATETVSNVLGVEMHYWAVVDFNGFREAVDILGGIDVFVEKSFDDYRFPREGYEDVWPESERWEHIHYDEGWQLMDGETALKFARSRHALGSEGTDFARAKRQQKVLLAAKEKALSISTLVNPIKIKELMSTFGSSVSTNIGVSEAQAFYESALKIDSESIISKVIDRDSNEEAGFLYTPKDKEPYGGAWVVVPKAGDFSEIQIYVQKLLYGD